MTYEGKEVLEENTVKGFFNKNQCWAETDVRAPTHGEASTLTGEMGGGVRS